MAVVSNFEVILGDENKIIGDRGSTIWEKNFNTRGRRSDGSAILMFMVKGLTATNQNVDVKINNQRVGRISNYNGADRDHWFTQIINVGGSFLSSGTNEIQIEAVGYDGSMHPDLYDDFILRDIVLFFQQNS